jgi:hypothetical protein
LEICTKGGAADQGSIPGTRRAPKKVESRRLLSKKKKVIENGGSSKKKTLSILFHENLNISSSFTPTSDIECSPFQFLEVLQQAVCVQILENTHLHC